MTWEATWTKVKSILPAKEKVAKVVEESTAKAHHHTFTCKVNKATPELVKDIERMLLLNPWITVGSKPVVRIVELNHEEKQLEIRFKTLSKTKTSLVASSIQKYVEPTDDLVKNKVS